MATSKEMAVDTLAMLHERLSRVDYVVNGDNSEPIQGSHTSGSANARLRTLERTLNSLVTRSSAAADTLALRKSHPTYFSAGTSTGAPSSLAPVSLVALVLAHSQLYASVSAQLTQLQDTPVADPASAVKLVDLRERIGKAAVRQDQQARELAELRARSAMVVERWYEMGVLEMGENWADWEERVREAEILVRRKEAAKKREQGVV